MSIDSLTAGQLSTLQIFDINDLQQENFLMSSQMICQMAHINVDRVYVNFQQKKLNGTLS